MFSLFCAIKMKLKAELMFKTVEIHRRNYVKIYVPLQVASGSEKAAV